MYLHIYNKRTIEGRSEGETRHIQNWCCNIFTVICMKFVWKGDNKKETKPRTTTKCLNNWKLIDKSKTTNQKQKRSRHVPTCTWVIYVLYIYIYIYTKECDGNTHQLTPLLFTKQTELCASCSTCSGSSSGTCSSGDIRLIKQRRVAVADNTIFLFVFFLMLLRFKRRRRHTASSLFF